MKEKDLQAVYIERLNAMLPMVDFAKLDRSCNSKDDSFILQGIDKRMNLPLHILTNFV